MTEVDTGFECSECGATIQPDATSCPSCGVSFEPAKPQEEVQYICSECGDTVGRDRTTCPQCGAVLYIQYYSVSTRKFALLAVCTLGVFQIFWFYTNWALIRDQQRRRLIPIVRAIFPYFFCRQLFKMALESAQSVGYDQKYSPWGLTATFIFFCLLVLLPDPLWFASLFSFVPLLTVQQAMNFTNSKLDSEFIENDKLSPIQLVLAVVGGVFLLLGIVATFSTM